MCFRLQRMGPMRGGIWSRMGLLRALIAQSDFADTELRPDLRRLRKGTDDRCTYCHSAHSATSNILDFTFTRRLLFPSLQHTRSESQTYRLLETHGMAGALWNHSYQVSCLASYEPRRYLSRSRQLGRRMRGAYRTGLWEGTKTLPLSVSDLVCYIFRFEARLWVMIDTSRASPLLNLGFHLFYFSSFIFHDKQGG